MNFNRVSIRNIQVNKRWALNGGPFGSKLVQKDYVETGVPVIRGCNLSTDGRFAPDDFVFVTAEKADELLPNNAHPGDLVFTQRGTLGQVGIIPDSLPYKRFVISQSQMKLTVDPEKADVIYLYYLFRTPHTVARIHNQAFSSGVPHINLEILRDFEIDLPPLPIQRRVAAILSAYDDLIENNTRRIKILEHMAQMLYREWFVNFRFPGHENVKMVESEMGQIPCGWEIKCVGDFGPVITGKTPPKERPELFGEGIPFIKLPDMHGNIFVLDTVEHLSSLGQEHQSNKTLPPNSISVSCIGTAGIVVITTRPSQTNQQINSVVLNSLTDREFLYFRLIDLKDTINQYGANGATMVNLNKTKFEGLRLVLPPTQFLEQYHNAVSPMFDCIKNLQERNDTLRKTRDFLLPKLVSGEISVGQIETEVASQTV